MTAKDKAKDRQRQERLATALRENLKRRKAQTRVILPGTGRGTAEGGGGAEDPATGPSVSAAALPPPRPGED